MGNGDDDSIPLQAPGPKPGGIAIRVDETERPPPPEKSFLQKYVSSQFNLSACMPPPNPPFSSYLLR